MVRLPTPVFLGFPCGSAGKESTCNTGDPGLILGWWGSSENEKATHSSILAWRIPWTVESMGWKRVGHNWVTFSQYMNWNMGFAYIYNQFLFVDYLIRPSILTSLVAQTVKNLPTMWETMVQSLGWEDLLEKEMATHSSILAWESP